jgi:hypothetical protein
MATSWLDLLPPKVSALDQNSFDTPRRTPLLNQGGAPPGIMRVSPRELRRLMQQSIANLTLVRDLDRFVDVVPVPYSLPIAGVAGGQLVLNAASPTKPRTHLVLCNYSAAGIVFIGVGGAADNATAYLRLVAGSQVILDVIPQNDIYASTDTAGAFGVFSYAISRLSA